MRAELVGFQDRKVVIPNRGERVASWVENKLNATGLSLGELAYRARVDKRDLQRLIRERSCGHRLEDDLARHFGWAFVEETMQPVIGLDPLAAREAELERQLHQAAALQARVERERAVRHGHAEGGPALAVVDRSGGVQAPRLGGERRAFSEPEDRGGGR